MIDNAVTSMSRPSLWRGTVFQRGAVAGATNRAALLLAMAFTLVTASVLNVTLLLEFRAADFPDVATSVVVIAQGDGS